MPRRCGISAAVFRGAGGKVLALLQPLRKQTRAPNDSNKPGRRLPLRLPPRRARLPGPTAAAEPGAAGKAGAPGPRRGCLPPGLTGRCGAVPAAARGAPAPPRSVGPDLQCSSGDTLRPAGRAAQSPRARPGRGRRGEPCAGSARRPAACGPLCSPPHRPAPPPRPRARES